MSISSPSQFLPPPALATANLLSVSMEEEEEEGFCAGSKGLDPQRALLLLHLYGLHFSQLPDGRFSVLAAHYSPLGNFEKMLLLRDSDSLGLGWGLGTRDF